MEGGVPIDPSTISLITKEGKDVFADLGIPRPDTAVAFSQDDSGFFIFCASMITSHIMQQLDEDNAVLSNKFAESAKNFGDTVFLFAAGEFIDRMNLARKKHTPEFGIDYGSIIYRDLEDFSHESTSVYRATGRFLDKYFVKANTDEYKIQNEWRLISGGSYEELKPNCKEGFLVDVGKFDCGYTSSLDDFIKNFKLSRR